MNITYDKKPGGLYAKFCPHAERQGDKILKTYYYSVQFHQAKAIFRLESFLS
jgi:hypothetical protein